MNSIKHIFVYFCSIALFYACGDSAAKQREKLWKHYEFTNSIKDDISATYVLNRLVALDSSDNTAKEKLANIYQKNNNHEGVYELLKNNYQDGNTHHSKMLAEAMTALGKAGEAKELLGKIVAKDTKGDIASRYAFATLLKADKDFKKALKILNEIVDFDNSLTTNMNVPNGQGGQQQVSYYAASHNSAGVIYFEARDFEKARRHFEEAIDKSPDFISARYNLSILNKKSKER